MDYFVAKVEDMPGQHVLDDEDDIGYHVGLRVIDEETCGIRHMVLCHYSSWWWKLLMSWNSP